MKGSTTQAALQKLGVVPSFSRPMVSEVFFKMAKQHLKLAKEIQCRDYDALIAYTTIVFLR